MPRYELDGQVAIVTGAGRGIGRATALRLAREGASVTVADINEANAKGVAEEIESTAGTAHPITVDVTSKTDTERMVSETVARFGKLDILVNNAGYRNHRIAYGHRRGNVGRADERERERRVIPVRKRLHSK